MINMDAVTTVFDELGVTGSAAAAALDADHAIGVAEHELVTPASVMKIQIAVAVEDAVAAGRLDGSEQRVLSPQRRTPGPVGISLMQDEVRMSTRDVVALMLTISDNVATDELIALLGLPAINAVPARVGLTHTLITSDLQTMLDEMAAEVGFADYLALARHDTSAPGSASAVELQRALAGTAALDPRRGTHTTAADTVRFVQAVWSDTVADPRACARVRALMAQQLTRHRLAAGFGPEVAVAAKSGGLMGVVRNEAGVVTYPDGAAYAVAVFTRRVPGTGAAPAAIDAGIGRVARALVDELRS
jgi:beta-lactamase class A